MKKKYYAAALIGACCFLALDASYAKKSKAQPNYPSCSSTGWTLIDQCSNPNKNANPAPNCNGYYAIDQKSGLGYRCYRKPYVAAADRSSGRKSYTCSGMGNIPKKNLFYCTPQLFNDYHESSWRLTTPNCLFEQTLTHIKSHFLLSYDRSNRALGHGNHSRIQERRSSNIFTLVQGITNLPLRGVP